MNSSGYKFPIPTCGIGLLAFLVLGGLQTPVSADHRDTDDLLTDEELPIILSATRLRQPQSETPAAVTVIDRQLIEASGARTLAELLRLVPGMQVGYERGGIPELSLHGFGGPFSRRLQVLVDGRSIYKTGLSRVLWTELQLSINDIDRIEVIRGPNTAAYGANSFLGVINIISRSPSVERGTWLEARHGNKGIEDYSLRHYGQLGDVDFRVTLEQNSDNGFDITREGDERHDSYQSRFFNLAAEYVPSLHDEWRLQLGASETDKEIDLLESFQQFPAHDQEITDRFLQLSWKHQYNANHESRWQFYYNEDEAREHWQTCPPGIFLSDELGALYRTDPDYTEALIGSVGSGMAPPPPPSAEVAALAGMVLTRFAELGLAPSCGTANQDFEETKWELEFQDTWRFNDALRLVAGFSLRKDTVKGETFFDGKEENLIKRLFANLEWRFARDFTANVGAMHEHDDNIGDEFSPRAAINWQLNPSNALRFVVAKGTRTPDFYEESAVRSYTVRDLVPPVNPGRGDGTYYQTSASRGGLASEKIWSRQVGWYHNAGNGLEVDVNLFHDSLHGLIDGMFGIDDFDPQNSIRATTEGVDLQISYRPGSNSRIWFQYAWQDLDLKKGRSSTDNTIPQNSLGLLGMYRFGNGLELSGGYYFMEEYFNRDYQRVDARIAKHFQLSATSSIKVEFVARHRLHDSFYFDRNNRYDSDTVYYLSTGLHF